MADGKLDLSTVTLIFPLAKRVFSILIILFVVPISIVALSEMLIDGYSSLENCC